MVGKSSSQPGLGMGRTTASGRLRRSHRGQGPSTRPVWLLQISASTRPGGTPASLPGSPLPPQTATAQHALGTPTEPEDAPGCHIPPSKQRRGRPTTPAATPPPTSRCHGRGAARSPRRPRPSPPDAGAGRIAATCRDGQPGPRRETTTLTLVAPPPGARHRPLLSTAAPLHPSASPAPKPGRSGPRLTSRVRGRRKPRRRLRRPGFARPRPPAAVREE